MILFELKCGKGHRFEAWFRDGATYEAQAAAGGIACAQCGDTHVEKAPMAPRLLKNRSDSAGEERRTAAEMRKALDGLRRHVEENCDYVGEQFPEEARRIHYGETDSRPIYGEASADEAKALKEEGVEVSVIPWLPRGN